MSLAFQYWTGAAWQAETDVIRNSVEDVLGFPMSAEVTIANPLNAKEATYNVNYMRVRIIENDTGEILFYGKVEEHSPAYDQEYGQILRIFARDNFQELLKRTLNTNYTGFVRRSALVAQIVGDHSYAGNIGTADPAKFEVSVVAEPAGQLDVNYDGSGKNVLRGISDISHEDPWNATPTGFGWDVYLDTTFVGAAPTPQMHYFPRGTRPAGGAAANGLTIRYAGTEGNQVRALLEDYSVSEEPSELTTLVRIEYVTSSGAVSSLTVMLIGINNYAPPPAFIVGETITGALSGTTAVVQYIGATFLCISSWSGNWTLAEQITGLTSGATANVQSVLRQTIETDVEKVLRGYSISNIEEARDKAAQLLFHGGTTPFRGKLSIIRWPFFIIGPSSYLVRVGQVVHVEISTLGIDEDMLVTRIVYDEGPGIGLATIEVLRLTRGEAAASHILDDLKSNEEVALWQTIGSAGGLPVTAQLVNLTNVFVAIDDDDISWGAGVAVFSDGSTQAVNANAGVNLPDANIRYIYLIKDNAVLQVSANFADVVGTNRVLVAIAKRSGVAGTNASIVSMNSGSPVLVGGTILANTLSAITANMGRLTAGMIEIGAGAPFTGFRLDSSYIAGYNAGVLQAYISSADGMLYAGAGRVILSAEGLILYPGPGPTGMLVYREATYQDLYVYQAGGYYIIVPAGAGTAISEINSYINIFKFSAATWTLGSITVPSTGIFLIGSGGAIRPNVDILADLGSSSFRWLTIYATDFDGAGAPLVIHDNLVPVASGVGETIGEAGRYFLEMHTKQLRLNAYTIATKPAFGDAGRIIYVSNEAAGQKFQGDDGAAWVYLG